MSDVCPTCNHPMKNHGFDIYPMRDSDTPCALSCTVCFDLETVRLEAQGKQ